MLCPVPTEVLSWNSREGNPGSSVPTQTPAFSPALAFLSGPSRRPCGHRAMDSFSVIQLVVVDPLRELTHS